jgi:hypothetical protein
MIMQVPVLYTAKKNTINIKNAPSTLTLIRVENLSSSVPDPAQLVKGTDPRIRIRTKMSWIRNAAFENPKLGLPVVDGPSKNVFIHLLS